MGTDSYRREVNMEDNKETPEDERRSKARQKGPATMNRPRGLQLEVGIVLGVSRTHREVIPRPCEGAMSTYHGHGPCSPRCSCVHRRGGLFHRTARLFHFHFHSTFEEGPRW